MEREILKTTKAFSVWSFISVFGFGRNLFAVSRFWAIFWRGFSVSNRPLPPPQKCLGLLSGQCPIITIFTGLVFSHDNSKRFLHDPIILLEIPV